MTAWTPPRPGVASLSLGLAVSVALHLAAAAVLVRLTLPSELPDQPPPKSELRIQTQAVREVAAPAQPAKGAQVAQSAAKGEAAAQGAIALTTAQPIAPPAQSAKALTPKAEAIFTAPPPQPLAATAPGTRVTNAATAPPSVIKGSTAAPLPLPEAAPPRPTKALTPTPKALPPATPRPPPSAALTPPSLNAPPVTPDISPVTATLAWAGAGGTLDPVSLKAIASFMAPQEARPDALHDGLAGLLGALPCARVQAEFDPETGALALRGHVPDPAMKAPLLAALQAQLGTGIAVTDDLIVLPRPQCGALSGIAEVGLPQSQDQLTNPRLIGADAQARTFTYGAGQSMVLDLAAPDYDAYVYVDYFDAGGQVIHLAPNDRVPLHLRRANAALKVGAQDQGEPFLQITVGPPYGQEIAVAFAASAPLFDGLRPLSEPATPYLTDLKSRVAEARARDPDFKGEWVYFMVVTHP